MLNQRTDLAIDAAEILLEMPEGISSNEYFNHNTKITEIKILDATGEEKIGKPIGTYITLHLENATHNPGQFDNAVLSLAAELKKILQSNDKIMITGLGNRAITPDAIGPSAMDYILITRHLKNKREFDGFKTTFGIAPGVLGITGIETSEIISGIADKTKPDCIIVIDALASKSVERLCNTVQITDTGITPGSGVGNSRKAINFSTLGVPVIAIGVPTVVDAKTLAEEISGGEANEEYSQMMITPKEIDSKITEISKLIGYGINSAVHDIPIEDIDFYLS